MAAAYQLKVPRPLQYENDLEHMVAILVEGCQTANGSFYIHPGDLSWWLYYLPHDTDIWQNIYLWDDEGDTDKLIAWTLLSPDWRTFDVFVAPHWHGSRVAEHIFTWSEERLAQIIQATGGNELRTMWVAEQDAWLKSMLTRHGFAPGNSMTVHMEQLLHLTISPASLPDGYRLRSVTGEHELERRALAQHAAFNSSLPFDSYCQRYRRFMRSPVYHQQHDLVIEAPGGEIAAFCIVWLDETNRVGLFEPVGVHPAFQRKGLGRVIIIEGLRHMQSFGMLKGTVNTEGDNYPAQRLYQSTGFIVKNRLITYLKRLLEEAA